MFQDKIPGIPNDAVEELRLLHGLKYGHSSSFGSHSSEPSEFRNVHSRDTLSVRHPYFPAFFPDISSENVHETNNRRVAHREMYTAHPGVFRRKKFPSSASETLEQRHIVRDFLTHIHPMRDNKESARRVPKQTELERHAPIQDFLLPDSLVLERRTGYSPGHIRSILGIDTYGPNSSSKRELQRAEGELPNSPQIDRNRHIRSPKPLTADGQPFCFLDNTPDSPDSPKSLSSIKSLATTSSRESQRFDTPIHLPRSTPFSKNISRVGTGNLDKTIPSGTLGYYGPALNEEEKSLADSRHKQLSYHSNFLDAKRLKQQRAEGKKKEAEYREKMKGEAKKERESIVQFESTLQTCYV